MKFFDRMRAAVKAFALGPAMDDSIFFGGGYTTSTPPEKYGNFLASSVPVYAASTLRASNIAGLPIRLYKVDGKGKKTPVTKGALYDLLEKVNPYYDWNFLIQLTELGLCTWAEGFWVMERGPNGNQKPKEMFWAKPTNMTVVKDKVSYIKGFIYREGATEIAFTPQEVIWFRYPNPLDEFSGLSPMASARLALETGAAALKSNNRIFSQGNMLAGLLTPENDQSWSKETVQDLERLLARRLSGLDNAHRVAVVSKAMKVTALGMTPKDAEFLGLMKWSKVEAATALKVPPELIGDHEHATYSNIEQAYRGLWTDCLIPECRFIASALKEQLLPIFGSEADTIEFDLSGVSVLQEDETAKTERASKWFAMGVPLNKVLQVYAPHLLPEGQDGYPWGDEPGGPVPPPPPPPPPPGGDTDDTPPRKPQANEERGVFLAGKSVAFGSSQHETLWKAFDARARKHERRIKAKVESLFEKQAQAIIASLPKGTKAAGDFDPEQPFDMDDWNEEFAASMLPVFERVVESAGVAVMEALVASVDFNVGHPQVRAVLRAQAQRFAQHVNETTWDRLKESLQEGLDAGEGIDELAQRVHSELPANAARVETIARTEAATALNKGALEAAKQSGVVKGKAWLATFDGRERPEHGDAHGKYQAKPIPLDEDFIVGGAKGPAPGDLDDPAMSVNCRCTLTWEIDEGDDPEKAAIRKEAASALAAWLARQDAHAAHEAA